MKKTIKPSKSTEALGKTLSFLWKIIKELFQGTVENTIPWLWCFSWLALINVFVYLDLEVMAFKWAGIEKLYEKTPEIFFIFIYLPIAALGFIVWAVKQIKIKKELARRLTNAFLSSKIKNYIGKVPNFISDYPVDEHTRKMTLTSESIPIETFKIQKKHLEAALMIYIDEFKQDIEKGITSIQYSHIPMPEIFDYNLSSVKSKCTYVAGCTRSKIISQSFKNSPHLLIGGQTGGGKSTLLRQIITSLYLNDDNAHFQLVDLKEGLEFQTFKNLKRINVVETLTDVNLALEKLDVELKDRMEKIKEEKCKDIDALIAKKLTEKESPLSKNNTQFFGRKYIVIDEAAEIFLGGGGEKLENIQKVRKAISRIARLGRACGMHLIIATQRPDVKALDPQVKANLTSIISFQMPNLASSMTILGNGKAAQIPFIPGRAILRSGNKLVDIQTPFLSIEEAEALLAPHRIEEESAATKVTKNISKVSISEAKKQKTLTFTEEESLGAAE